MIFGVTGDLARKKLMPAIYDLAHRGLLPAGFSLVGFARRDWEHQDFGELVHDSVKEHARTPFKESVWNRLAEGITLRFGSKVPGTTMEVRDVTMDFGYGHAFTESSPEAYERLILDVLLGEPSLFPVNEEVELSWEILDPILDHWAKKGAPEQYPPGSWGPPSADEMLERTGRNWRRP